MSDAELKPLCKGCDKFCSGSCEAEAAKARIATLTAERDELDAELIQTKFRLNDMTAERDRLVNENKQLRAESASCHGCDWADNIQAENRKLEREVQRYRDEDRQRKQREMLEDRGK